MSKTTLKVQGREIALFAKRNTDYLSLTDIAKYRNETEAFSVINNWMRTRSTIEFLGLWEKLNNPDLNLSISRGLDRNRGATILYSLLKSGLKTLEQSE